MSKDLSGLFFPDETGRAVQFVESGYVTAWDSATKHSTVVVGGVVVYTNPPICASAVATMAVGALVLLTMTSRGPIVYDTLIVPV